jgi:hypothetical protein
MPVWQTTQSRRSHTPVEVKGRTRPRSEPAVGLVGVGQPLGEVATHWT